MATMYKRAMDGMWCEKVLVDGKMKYVYAKTESALRKKLKDMKSYQTRWKTFEQCADEWETAHDGVVEENTMNAYRPHIRRAKEYFEGEYMADITPDEVQSYVDDLAAKRFARDTVHRALNVVNMIFRYAITMKGSPIRYNPCTAVSLPKGLSKKRREPPTEEQIIKVTPDSTMGLFAFFLLFTGLRRGELLALRWEDIDREEKKIRIRKAVSYSANQPTVKNRPKTAAGVRDVALLDVLADALPEDGKGYVFGGEKPLTATQFRKQWISWCRSVGLAEAETTTRKGSNGHTYTATKWHPLVTPHQFRHEYASMLEDAEVSEFEAKNQLGHSSIMVTKDIYTHIREKKAGAAVAGKLNAYLEGKRKKGE